MSGSIFSEAIQIGIGRVGEKGTLLLHGGKVCKLHMGLKIWDGVVRGL